MPIEYIGLSVSGNIMKKNRDVFKAWVCQVYQAGVIERKGIPEDRVSIIAQSGDIHSRDIKWTC